MEKLKQIEGYTLVETIAVLLLITICSLTTIKLINIENESRMLIAEYSYQQFKAMNELHEIYFVYDNLMTYKPIVFNKKGNINISQTIVLNGTNEDEVFVIFLGGGRIELKE